MKRTAAAAIVAVTLLTLVCTGSAFASSAQWRLEQPLPPAAPNGQKSEVPIGLGKVGDIEFWAPNRGLLITEGNPPTIPAGLWAYNGVEWHELATVCGATNGRIAWAGPEEFWTVANGRRGQAVSDTDQAPPLEDNTLCHFSGGKVVTSYAKPAFEAASYQAMAAAACFGPTDCWFGGAELPEPQIGAFQLHWNGQSLNEEADPQGYPIESMKLFGEEIYEGVHIGRSYEPPRPAEENRLGEPESPTEPSDLHVINREGIEPTFLRLTSPSIPVYTDQSEPSWALGTLNLGTDEASLWGAANPLPYAEFPEESDAHGGQVTIVRYDEGTWQQVLGAEHPSNPLTPYVAPAGHGQTSAEKEAEAADQRVAAIAPEPSSEDAWLALGSPQEARAPVPSAKVARISPSGAIESESTLPSEQERADGGGPKGQAAHVICPAAEDCWLVTTRGWLYHYANSSTRTLERDTSPAFSSLITERPPDEGVPQVNAQEYQPEETIVEPTKKKPPPGNGEPRRRVALVSHVHSRLVHGSTLELRFRLAVKTRIRLVALRRHRVVAATRRCVLKRGERRLLLRLDPKRWPSKIELQTHPLAPVPTERVRKKRSSSESEVTTSGFADRLLGGGRGAL